MPRGRPRKTPLSDEVNEVLTPEELHKQLQELPELPPDIPPVQDVPPVTIPPKRQPVPKKVKPIPVQEDESEYIEIVKPKAKPKQDIQVVTAKPKRTYTKKKVVHESSEEEEFPPVMPPIKRQPKKKAPPPTPRYQYNPDTSDDEDDESEEDIKVDKYVQKTYARMEALKAIEQKMRAMNNPYERKGMSVF